MVVDMAGFMCPTCRDAWAWGILDTVYAAPGTALRALRAFNVVKVKGKDDACLGNLAAAA
jgi:hypothetical protein